MRFRDEVFVQGNATNDIARRLQPSRLLDPALRSLRVGLAQEFRSEGMAGGRRWAALAERTQNERKAAGYSPAGPILRRTGRYRRSWEARVEGEQIVVGSADLRAPALQYGSVTRNLPDRPVVVPPSAVKEAIDAVVKSFLSGGR